MRNINPLISIVIVAGPNRREELFRCIRSVLSSTHKNYEVIVIDNSMSKTLSQKVRKNFSGISVYTMPKNTGIFAYNLAFSNTRGEYILVVDDDGGIRKNTLKKIATSFQQGPRNVGILSCNVYSPHRKTYYYENVFNRKKLFHFAGEGSVIKREVINKIGLYDDDFFCWFHEIDFAIRAINSGYVIRYAKDIIVDHYKVEGIPRPFEAFLTFRNMAWFNFKHFSIWIIPFLIARNIVTLLALLFRKKSFTVFFYAVLGYILGLLKLSVPLKKRKTVTFSVQKNFVKFYLFNIQ